MSAFRNKHVTNKNQGRRKAIFAQSNLSCMVNRGWRKTPAKNGRAQLLSFLVVSSSASFHVRLVSLQFLPVLPDDVRIILLEQSYHGHKTKEVQFRSLGNGEGFAGKTL